MCLGLRKAPTAWEQHPAALGAGRAAPGRRKAPGDGVFMGKIKKKIKKKKTSLRLSRVRTQPGREKMNWKQARARRDQEKEQRGRAGVPTPPAPRDAVLGHMAPSKIFQLSLHEVRLEVAKSLFWPLNNPEGGNKIKKTTQCLLNAREELRCCKFSQTRSCLCKNSSRNALLNALPAAQ